MLGRSASRDEVLIIHLCLMGNESTSYSKHPFERGKHIEMNFVTKLEPFSMLPCLCINSSFLFSAMSSCTLQHFSFFSPIFPPLCLLLLSCSNTLLSLASCSEVLILHLTLGIFPLLFISHFKALQTSEAQLYFHSDWCRTGCPEYPGCVSHTKCTLQSFGRY